MLREWAQLRTWGERAPTSAERGQGPFFAEQMSQLHVIDRLSSGQERLLRQLWPG